MAGTEVPVIDRIVDALVEATTLAQIVQASEFAEESERVKYVTEISRLVGVVRDELSGKPRG